MATTRSWVGNAQAVAQAETWAPGTQSPGTTATATMNGKSCSYTSLSGTNDDLIAGLITAIGKLGAAAPEFNEVTFAAASYVPAAQKPNATYLLMTAKVAGNPFQVNISLTTPAKVSVTRVVAGQAGVNELQQITIAPNAQSGSAFILNFNGQLTTPIPTPPKPPTFNAFVASGALTGNYYYVVTFGTAAGETEPSAASAQLAPAAQNVTLNIPFGPANCTFRRVYRGLAGGAATGPFYLVAKIGDNSTATYTDSSTDATIKLNAGPPATNGCAQGELELLSNVGIGNVKVGGAGVAAVPGQNMPTSPIVYQVQFTGALANLSQPILLGTPYTGSTILPTLTVTETQAGYPIQSAIQLVGWKQVYGVAAPSGSLKIALPGLGATTGPIAFNASAATVLAAIQAAAPASYANSFAVALGPAAPAAQPQLQGLWQITYQDKLANTAVPQATVDPGGLVAASGDTISAFWSTTQPGSSTGRNEIATVTINNNPSGGTFGLTATLANGNAIAATGVAFNASGATLAAAFPSGTVNVSGGAGGPYTVEGAGEAGSQKIAFVASSSLTGASSVAGSPPTTNTAGVDPPTISASLFTSGGSLATGSYYYAVTAVNANGETTANPVAVNVTGPDGGVNLSWSSVPTATSYNVYRGTSPGAENTKLCNTTQRVFLDYGGLNIGGTAPSFNSTGLSSPASLGASVIQGVSDFTGSSTAGTYYYKVTATNGIGESLPSTEVSVSIGNYQAVQLEWNSVNGATGFKVYRGTSSGGENTLIATLPVENFGGNQSFFVDTFPPNTSVSPPTSDTSGLPGSVPVALYARIESGIDTPGLPAGTYYYKITAVTAAGETTPSGEVSVSISTGQMVAVAWSESNSSNLITSYKVYRGTTINGENLLVANISSASGTLSYIDLGGTSTALTPPVSNTTGIAAPTQNALTPGGADGNFSAGTYYYKVTATTPIGETTGSNEQSSAIVAGGFATVNWNAVSHATGYKIYRGTSAGAENILAGIVSDGAATAFTDTAPLNSAASPPTSNTALIAAPTQSALSTSSSGGNLASATYFYKVTAITRAGETTGSNEQSIAVTGPTGQVTVSWTADTGADGYKIYRGTSAGAENVLAGSTATTSFVDFGTVSAAISVVELVAGAAAVNEVQTVTLNGATGGSFSLDFAGQATTNVAYNASAATLQADLVALSNIGANNATVAGAAGGPFTVTYTGTLAGAPQPLLGANNANLQGSTTANQTLTITTASTGPNNWDNAGNWSPAGVPSTGDTVVIQNSSVDILYGLNQSAVTLANLQIDMSFVGGWIGLPNWNSNKYSEYRQQYLQIGVSGQVVIGNGKGSGPTLLKFDFGTQAFSMLVNGCGTNQDPTLPAILVKGNRASGSSQINCYKGKLGVAMFAGETATVDTIRQGFLTNKNSDSYVFVGSGVTVTTWQKDGGDGVLNAPIATLRHEDGTLTVLDGLTPTTVGTLSLVGGSLTDRATGTITTLTVGTGAIYDRTDDSRAKTITNTTLYGKSEFLDPHGSITFTNPIVFSNCGIPDLVELDLGSNITLQRVQL